jgi:hypothetical protein
MAAYIPFDRIEPKVAAWRRFEYLEQGYWNAQCTRDSKGMRNDLSGMLRPVDASDDVLGTPLSISPRIVLGND